MNRRAVPFLVTPAVAAIAGLFLVLPRTGAGLQVHIASRGSAITYNASQVSLRVGDRVEFVNDTRQTHTATCVGCAWDSGDIQPGQSVVVAFDTGGTFSFTCRYHSNRLGEAGTLTVSR